MKYFRINIYLKFKIYLFAFFLIKNKFENKIEKLIKENSKKKSICFNKSTKSWLFAVIKILKVQVSPKK